jgi:hypothetical protein
MRDHNDPDIALAKLSTSVTEARSRGWSECDLSIDEALAATTRARIPYEPTRRSGQGGAIALLRPTLKDKAHPSSLSARYGLEAFPLHTDGAHLRNPPTIVLLQARSPTFGATLVHRMNSGRLSSAQLSSFRHGVFVVGAGNVAFYCHAMSSDHHIRFDPGCMTALDPDARYVQQRLREEARDAERYRWRNLGLTLVLDNTTSLHGREQVSNDSGRKIRRLMLHWPK